MNKKIYGNLFLLISLNLLIKPFWILGIDRAFQNQLGFEQYGLYSSLFSLALWMQVILDPGLHAFINTSISREQHLFLDYYKKSFPVKIWISLAYFLLTIIIGFSLGFKSNELMLLAMLGFNQILSSFILFIRSGLSARFFFFIDSFFSVLDKAIMIVFGAIILLQPQLDLVTINNYILLQTVAYFIVLVSSILYKFPKEIFKHIIPKKQDAKQLLLSSLPFAILGLLMTLYTRMDAIMIERMLPDGNFQAGMYAGAYRLLDASNNIAYLFSVILLPIFSKLMVDNIPKIKEVINPIFRILFVPSCIYCLICFYNAPFLMNLMYHNNTNEVLILNFKFLNLTLLSYCFIYTYGALLTAGKKIRILNYSSLVGLGINFSINLFLIPKYGAFGAVIATLITQSLVSIYQMWKAREIFHLKENRVSTLKMILFVGLSILTFHYGPKYLHLDGIIKILVLSFISLNFALILGFFPIRKLIHIIKEPRANKLNK